MKEAVTPPLRNFWYPILDAHDLPQTGKLLRIKRFSTPLVVWCSEDGTISCFEDRCAHRGAPLGLGKVDGECLRCPYHGFSYDSQGNCIHVPALAPEDRIPAGLHVTTYSVREEHGYLWMWWGSDTPAREIPFFDELKTAEHPKSVSEIYPSRFHRLMESHLDGYHIDHLHGNVSPQLGPYIHNMKTEVWPKNIRLTTQYARQAGGKVSSTVINHLLFPNLALSQGVEAKMWNVIASCPIDDENTWFMVRFYFAPFRWPALGSIFHGLFRFYIHRILLPQDFAVQKEQNPRDIGLGRDKLISADRGIVEYWKMLREELEFSSTSSMSSPLEEPNSKATPGAVDMASRDYQTKDI